MNKALEIAVVLSAVDRMTQVFNNAVDASSAKLKSFQEGYQKNFKTGTMLVAAGLSVGAALAPAIDAYTELEASSTRLKTVMLADGGILSENFKEVNKVATELGGKLPGTTADFQNMMSTLLKSGVSEKSILDGVGKSAAYLGVALKLPYEDAAKMAAKLKEATGVSDNEMLGFMDTIARVNQVGVESGEMQFAFARSAGSLKLMGIQGLEASKSLAGVYAQLIKTGASGETVGTGMSAMFDAFLNQDKMKAFNKEAGKLGLNFEFVDQKTGQFKGVENMIAQLDQMKGLNTQQRATLVSTLLGPGADAKFMNTLIAQGVDGFNEMQRNMAHQATLNAKVEEQLGTLEAVKEAAQGSMTNALASFGASFADELKVVWELFGRLMNWIQGFIEAHPKLFKFVGLFIAISSAVLVLVGVFFILKAAVLAFNAVVLGNPVLLIIALIIAAAVAIYVYWDEIVAFFVWVWDAIKAGAFTAWAKIKQAVNAFLEWFKGWGKYVMLIVAPFIAIPLLIWQNWDKIIGFLSHIGDRIVDGLSSFWDWFVGIHTKMFNAGSNIIKSLWQGIKSMASKPVEAIKDIVQKMRNLLPFSPAKDGPFKDLHKVQIVETFAKNIRSAPAVNAATSVMADTKKVFAGKSPLFGGASGGGATSGGGGGTVVINYNPTINFGGSVTPETQKNFMDQLRQHSHEIMRMIEENARRKKSLAF